VVSNSLGFLDFAGSGLVHLCGASAALAGVLVLGAREGKYGKMVLSVLSQAVTFPWQPLVHLSSGWDGLVLTEVLN